MPKKLQQYILYYRHRHNNSIIKHGLTYISVHIFVFTSSHLPFQLTSPVSNCCLFGEQKHSLSHTGLCGISHDMVSCVPGPPDTPTGLSSEVMAAAEPPSVRVSWNAVSGADSYNVSFTRVRGSGQILCPMSTHSSEVTSNDNTVEIEVDEEEMVLYAFSTYSYTVTAVNDIRGSSEPSSPETLTTPQIGMS